MNKPEIAKITEKDSIIDDPRLSEWTDKISRRLLSAAVNSAISLSREKTKEGKPFDEALLFSNINVLCGRLYNRRLRHVINATGTVINTEMGRSAISPEVWDDCRLVNTGNSSLNLSLTTGKHENRKSLVPYFITALTGAESCTLVNNNAAALYIILAGLSAGKEVIVSRGELLQFDGDLRIPDIIRLSGAIPVEVGTVNITTLEDYIDAITDNTAMILKIHQAGLSARGYYTAPSAAELSSAVPENIIIAVDQGSGILNESFQGESNVKTLISDGADIVAFSGDKVIGGPQAGIIAGRKALIKNLEQNPLYRTMRPGKTIYSLLETTLLHRCNTESAESQYMEIVKNPDEIKEKCKKLKRGISADFYKLSEDRICISGCGYSKRFLKSWAVEIISEKMKPESILKFLRNSGIPVIAKRKGSSTVLNPAGFSDDDIKYVKSVLKKLEELL